MRIPYVSNAMSFTPSAVPDRTTMTRNQGVIVAWLLLAQLAVMAIELVYTIRG